MSEAQQPPITIQHRVRRMTGRDPDEQHRVATPLELLFDLTFVVAFGIAANEFAHLLAEDHVGAGLLGFLFATFAVCWAWINFTWFASAYDTDDWVYRLMTMVQMVGVSSWRSACRRCSRRSSTASTSTTGDGGRVRGHANRVGGAVVTGGQTGPRAPSACLTYATVVTVAQVGWIGRCSCTRRCR